MRQFFLLIVCLQFLACEAKLPELTTQDVISKADEIMESHAAHKELTPPIVKRLLINYMELLDPTKVYFIQSDIRHWIEPSDDFVQSLIDNYRKGDFTLFHEMHEAMVKAVNRRREINQKIDYTNLPVVKSEEFKDLKWAQSTEELVERLRGIRSLQLEAAEKLSDDVKGTSMQRVAKYQNKFEENILNTQHRANLVHSNILKATASSLDSHTAYFTPTEAQQFMMNVQQRLFGIGAQLRDDLNGLTITKIMDGGPAANSKLLKLKDRIVAVNGEPIVGMDISDAVDLIRGEENTTVELTIVRENKTEEGVTQEEKLIIPMMRGEVVIKESRIKTSYEPYGNGVIGYIRLFSFYQDPQHSSTSDLEEEINKLKKEHHLLGLVLDLRYNTGGLLSEAVGVSGLFISKGTVVSIKDEKGRVQHLRELDSKVTWGGPLVVLTNRMSASASEIVAQSLQDYKRALIVGDDHTYGKGSFQVFTLSVDEAAHVNPKGEFKVTRGRYYTVSGKSPQLTGVLADIVLPGPLSQSEIGEKFLKYPLETDQIKANFKDDLADISFFQREKVRQLYKFGLQEKSEMYTPYLEHLKQNAQARLDSNQNYQNFIKELQKKGEDEVDEEEHENFGQNDLQLEGANAVLKDLILMMKDAGAEI